MHNVESFERIRRAFLLEGWSVRKIAKVYHVHRRIVRKAIAGAVPPAYERDGPPKASSLTPHLAWIDEVLTKDKTQPRKQRHTARRIHERLVAERKYKGGESTVRRHVARRKRELRIGQPAVYIPLAHPPGRDGQVDWGDAIVRIAGQVCCARLLTVTACNSGAFLTQAFPVAMQECFFEGLLRAFVFFGGVFHRIAFDNLRVAVKRVLQGRNRVEQEAFVAFRSHHLFTSLFCLPGEEGAHEKGSVEGRVGYGRRNFLVPVPDAPSWEALNEMLADRCRQELTRTAQGKSETIGALLAKEKPLLLPLPTHPFDCSRKLFVRADSHSRIRVDGIRYSIPTLYAYRDLLVKVTASEIVVVHGEEVIARLRRQFDAGEQVLDPLHYVDLLTTKPHALDYGIPFQGWRLPAVFGEIRQKLEPKGLQGLKDYIRVLQAIPRCDVHTVASAIDETLRAGRVDAEAVLDRLAARGVPPAPKPPARPVLRVADPNVRQYDQLLRKDPIHGNESAPEGVSEAVAVAGHGT
jgi:transposase